MRVLPPAPALAVERARRLRRDATPAEMRLWRALRSRALDGVKVRRQVPFGPYIIDFAIAAEQLVIEVDGETHGQNDQVAQDERRDAWLAAQGWRVVRFSNAEVMRNLNGVLQAVLMALGRGPHPRPLPQGEGDVGPA